MHRYTPPSGPLQVYSEGFWYGFAAAIIYLVLTILLLINLIGYIRGHYPQHFELSEDQQTLIVQTMLYFVWLSGGAGTYSRIEGWRFVDALYWSDVTILTIGFGDLYPKTIVGQALLIPYSIVGIIMLGLVITSIFRSVEEIGQKNIVRLHYERERERIIGRTVTTSLELERREIELELARERAHHRHHTWHHHHQHHSNQQQSHQSTSESHSWLPHFHPHLHLHRPTTTNEELEKGNPSLPPAGPISRSGSISSMKDRPGMTRQTSRLSINSISKKKTHIMLLRKEKERFEAMRKIQKRSEVWKNWWRLCITFTFYTLFWYVY
jgi:potassium channel subfamily K